MSSNFLLILLNIIIMYSVGLNEIYYKLLGLKETYQKL